ncbi:hypothetical protein [Methanobrevibacter sp.]|uniref:hypothetical protein n=1 Tax=Methanobrevibacter sp. TaxID=66852 RepID=UPI003864710E
MSQKRLKLIFNWDTDEWRLFDTKEQRFYDVDVSAFQKQYDRLERNHKNLHEKYENLEEEKNELLRKYSRLKGNKDSLYSIYLNLKRIYEEGD